LLGDRAGSACAASGKRTAIRSSRRRVMIAASGIQPSFPSGKKKAAIPGDISSTGGSPSSRIRRALMGP
jgi:hypothetical protein